MSGAEIDAGIRDWHVKNINRALRESGMDPEEIAGGLQAVRDLHAHELAEKIRKVEVGSLPSPGDHQHFVRFGFNRAADLIDPEHDGS